MALTKVSACQFEGCVKEQIDQAAVQSPVGLHAVQPGQGLQLRSRVKE